MANQMTTAKPGTAKRRAISTSGYAYFQGQFMPVEEANVNVMTHAFLYGTAVFEGIRGYAGESQPGQVHVFRLAEHLERIRCSAGILKMRLPDSVDEMMELTRKLIRGGDFHGDVYIRMISYKASRRIGLYLDDEDGFTMFALPVLGDYLNSEGGVNVGVSSWRRIEDNAIPSRAKINGSYVNLALGAEEARANGFDEALLLNEDGHLSEAAGMNVCLVRKGVLVTPGVEANILEGITRDSVQQIAQTELGLRFECRNVDRTELYTADEAFLCGTAAEIAPITSVDRRPVGSGRPGPITTELMRTYKRLVRGDLPAYRNWLYPVYD